ncbi:hypothetical protein CPC16_006005 [Podila verticillata]|nr:hypothetical protein CPC16_006005 [Podila verticillata]
MHSTLCRRTSSPSASTSSSFSSTSTYAYNPLLMVSKCFGDKIDRHPLALAMVQYSMAATQAFTLYFLSVICSLVHSVMIIATIEGLGWIQTFGPLVLEWDSFLFGAVFLTMEIDLGSMDPASKSYYISTHEEEARSNLSKRESDKSTPPHFLHHYKPSSSVSSNSSSSSNKRVTFDEQVLVLGTATVAKHNQITPIDTRIDPSVPLTESPTRTSPPRCASPPLTDPHSSNSSSKRFIHKIMHPHQHKRQQQQQAQLQIMTIPCPDTTDSCASSISSTGSNSSKKSLAQRLGLKKKKQI